MMEKNKQKTDFNWYFDVIDAISEEVLIFQNWEIRVRMQNKTECGGDAFHIFASSPTAYKLLKSTKIINYSVGSWFLK